MGRGVNTGALSPVGGIGEIRMSERIYAKRQERNTMQGDRDIAGQLDYDS